MRRSPSWSRWNVPVVADEQRARRALALERAIRSYVAGNSLNTAAARHGVGNKTLSEELRKRGLKAAAKRKRIAYSRSPGQWVFPPWKTRAWTSDRD